MLPFTPQVMYKDTVTDSNWVRLSAVMTADSAYDNLVIGEFRQVANGYSGYYYFDSVVVSDTIIITGIGEDYLHNDLMLYPNPVHDELHVDNVASGTTLLLLDLPGSLIQTTTTMDGKAVLNMAALSPGTYLLQMVREGTTTVTKRVLKE